MRIANIDHIDMHAQSTITKKERNIELVMVLDTTGSMASGGKITALKSAAKQMVATLFEGNDTSSTLKIGVVPFAAAVNIGSDKINSGWLDTNSYSAANATADPIPFEDLGQTAGISPLKLYSGNSFSGAATSLTNRKLGRLRARAERRSRQLPTSSPTTRRAPARPRRFGRHILRPTSRALLRLYPARATRTTIYATILQNPGPLAPAPPRMVQVPILGPASRMLPVVPVVHPVAPTPAQHQPTATM